MRGRAEQARLCATASQTFTPPPRPRFAGAPALPITGRVKKTRCVSATKQEEGLGPVCMVPGSKWCVKVARRTGRLLNPPLDGEVSAEVLTGYMGNRIDRRHG